MSPRVGVVSAWARGRGRPRGPGRSGEEWEIRARASSSRRVVDVAPRRRGAEGRAAGRVVSVARDRPVDRQPAKWRLLRSIRRYNSGPMTPAARLLTLAPSPERRQLWMERPSTSADRQAHPRAILELEAAGVDA
jgi:hypothetical protein